MRHNRLIEIAAMVGLAWAASATALAAQTASDFAEALERSAAVSPCVPSAELLQQGTIHAIQIWSADEIYHLELGDNLRAVHLIIRHGRSREIALDVPDGVEVLSVQLSESEPAMVSGLQDETLVYRHGFAPDGSVTYEHCTTDNPFANDVDVAVRYFGSHRFQVHRLDDALTRYTGSGLDSMSLSTLWTDYMYLSQEAIYETETARRIGAGMLAHLSFPAPPVVNPEPLSPPPGLSSAEFFDWLIDSGAAEPASEEAQEFICVYEAALVMAAGIDATHRSPRCRLLIDPWRDQLDRLLVLVRPISVGEYRCASGRREFRLFGTEEAPVIGEIANCGSSVGQF